MSLGKYILTRSLRALVAYVGVIAFTFFILIIPLLSIEASLMCLVRCEPYRLPFYYIIVEQDIVNWALVPHPDAAEFLHMFLRHMMNCLSGDFGHSFLSLNPVTEDLSERISNSALLIGVSIFSSLIIGSALVARQEGEVRGKESVVGRITTHVSSSTPTFWLGMMVLFAGSYAMPGIFGFGFPEFGTISYEVWLASVSSGAGAFMIAIDVLFHLFLPMIVLTTSGSAFIFSTLKSNLTENLTQKNLIIDRKKGRGIEYTFYSNLKNSLAVIKQWLPTLISSIILVEVVFTWRGIGRFLFESVLRMDFPVIRGCIIILSLFIIAGHLILDIAFNILVKFETNLNGLEKCEIQSQDYKRYFIERCR